MKDLIIIELNLLELEKTELLSKLIKLKDNHKFYNSVMTLRKSIKINNRLTDVNKLIELNTIEYDNLQLDNIV